MGALNAVVWPVLARFALPLSVLTLGLGALVLNGVLVAFAIDWCPARASTTSGPESSSRSASRWSPRCSPRCSRSTRTSLVPQRGAPPGRAGAATARRRTCRASSSWRSTAWPTTCCGARCATATRRRSRAGCATAATASCAGRPTGPRRPAPARRGCCTATTTTCPRSAGGRRIAAAAIVTNHPRDAAEIERRHSDGRGLLHADGASRANILSGDAPHSMLTMSTVLDRTAADRAGLLRLLRAARTRVARTLLLSIGEIFARALRRRPAGAARRAPAHRPRPGVRARARLGDRRPARPAGRRGHRRHARRAARGLHDVPRLRRGRPPLRASSGRTRSRCCARSTARSPASPPPVADAPRPYRLVVLSDHGQSQGATFLQRYGDDARGGRRAAPCDGDSVQADVAAAGTRRSPTSAPA